MNLSVLVIDDDPGTREALVEILRRAGYQVTPLEGADQDLGTGLYHHCCQVAVVDYHLPCLNGLEVARRLKGFQPDCRIIMISSEQPNFEEIFGQTTVDCFLAKPFSKDVILEAVARLCPLTV
jgi:CheY-like chemotaxis protein